MYMIGWISVLGTPLRCSVLYAYVARAMAYARGCTLEDFLDLLTYETADGNKRCAADGLAPKLSKICRCLGQLKLNTSIPVHICINMCVHVYCVIYIV